MQNSGAAEAAARLFRSRVVGGGVRAGVAPVLWRRRLIKKHSPGYTCREGIHLWASSLEPNDHFPGTILFRGIHAHFR